MRVALLGLLVVCLRSQVLCQLDLTEVFCEGEPKCSDDNLSIVFDETGDNVWFAPTFTPDTKVACTVSYILRKDAAVPPAPFRVCEGLPGADCKVSNCGE